jgi:hypothetical protein
MNEITKFFYKLYNYFAKDYSDEEPIVVNSEGNKFWIVNGKIQRNNDLPAVEWFNGDKWWFVNGERQCDNDLPAIENANGDKYWYVNRKLHRDHDLPAIEKSDGDKYWYVNGQIHRLGGSYAIEYADGNKQWLIHNKHYTLDQVCNYYKILKRFGRYCLRKIRMRQLRHSRWINVELLCMPSKGSYPGGQDYHQMVSYFMSM